MAWFRRGREAPAPLEERGAGPAGWWVQDSVLKGGIRYPLVLSGSARPDLSTMFEPLVGSVGAHPVVAAAVAKRALLISGLRFTFRRFSDRETFGGRALDLIDRPAMGLTRNTLLSTASQHVDYAGTAWFARTKGGLRLLRPDWVDVVMATETELPQGMLAANALPIDLEVLGYVYWQGGRSAKMPVTLLASDVAAWAPEPDPICWWRGQSWVSSVVRDVALDMQAEDHVTKFFENAATPNVVYSMSDKMTAEQLREFTELFRAGYEGSAENAWRSIIVGGGADVTVVGATPNDLGLRDLRGGLETHVSMRSQVPAVLLGIREGMQGSALNSGNYGQTRRMFADSWFTPTSQGLAGCLGHLVAPPLPRGSSVPDAELWPDVSDVLFLQEDAKDGAEIIGALMQAVRTAVDGGFDPATAVDAVFSGNLKRLSHTGLTSVQLLPPGQGTTTTNGGAP